MPSATPSWNNVTRNVSFETGAYPANPSPTFGQILAVGDSRTLQFAVRARFYGWTT